MQRWSKRHLELGEYPKHVIIPAVAGMTEVNFIPL